MDTLGETSLGMILIFSRGNSLPVSDRGGEPRGRSKFIEENEVS